MGEPAEPTPVERARRRALAREFIAAVTEDREDPLQLLLASNDRLDAIKFGDLDCSEDIELMMFGLAQEIVLLIKESGR